jgi:hypothetical protein
MRHLVRGALAGALLLRTLGPAALAAGPTHAFQVPEGKYLHLTIPEGLSVEAADPRLGTLSIEIRPKTGPYVLLLTAFPPLPTRNRWPN